MHSQSMIAVALGSFLAVTTHAALAQAPTPEQSQTQQKSQVPQPASPREQIYGSQLMTQQERNDHSARMRAAKTQEERERIRAEHHEQMKARAKERGITLPDQPRGQGGGMGPGGGGMGPGGGGMGPGGGPR